VFKTTKMKLEAFGGAKAIEQQERAYRGGGVEGGVSRSSSTSDVCTRNKTSTTDSPVRGSGRTSGECCQELEKIKVNSEEKMLATQSATQAGISHEHRCEEGGFGLNKFENTQMKCGGGEHA